MTNHILWPSIELFHNVIKTLKLIELRNSQPLPVVSYRAKVKLHGANMAIQIRPSGMILQSRTEIITEKNDYKGFAHWAIAHRAHFIDLPQNIILFGEWCGPGVEPFMAVSNLPNRIFAIFALQIETNSATYLETEEEKIREILGKTIQCPNLYVLPWEDLKITINFASQENLDQAALLLNQVILDVEKQDPWVQRTFGLSGLGEGLVLYPTLTCNSIDEYARLMFKVKGEKHRTIKSTQAVQIDPVAVANIDAFVDLVLTEARLQQGLSLICPENIDVKLIGRFIQWIASDVQKESKSELEASDLTWTQIEKPITQKARNWFLSKYKKK